MKRIRVVGLCLVAVFAFSAVAVASASAHVQPEFMTCGGAAKNPTTKKYEGAYEKGCTTTNAKHEGKYEVSAVTPGTTFEGKSKTSTFYVYEAGKGVTWELSCKKDKDKSTIESATEGELEITFESCSLTNEVTKAKAIKCASSFTLTGSTLTTETLPGEEPAVLLIWRRVVPFECGSVKGEIGGSATPAAKLESSKKGPLAVFTVNKTTGESEPREWYFFEEELAELITPVKLGFEGGPRIYAGLETTEPLGPKAMVVVN